LNCYLQKVLLCAITDRGLLPGSEVERREGLVALARSWAREGVDYIQVREKDLSLSDLRTLAFEIVAAVRSVGTHTQILLNGPAEVALEAGADGVHLPSNSPADAPEVARGIYIAAGLHAVVSRACHSVEEVQGSRDASLILYAPVFEKVMRDSSFAGQGLVALGEACRGVGSVPVLALGGVTAGNAWDCVAAGAAGVGGIRLFLDGGWRGLR
jgi:thiamine-phosphate pyrophosphorylase